MKTWVQTLGPTWEKERNNSSKLSLISRNTLWQVCSYIHIYKITHKYFKKALEIVATNISNWVRKIDITILKAMQLHYNKILKIQETEKIMKITQENWNIICHGSLDYQLTSYQKWVFLISSTFLYLQLFRKPRRGDQLSPDSESACVMKWNPVSKTKTKKKWHS